MGFYAEAAFKINFHFFEEELIARIEAVMKRMHPASNNGLKKNSCHRQIHFRLCHQTLMFEDQKQVITIRETAVLKLLYDHRGQILDRRNTLKQLWVRMIISPPQHGCIYI